MKSKEQALHLPLEKSGDAACHKDIYRKYVIRKIEEGIKAADDGRIVSHDEVKNLFVQVDHAD